MKSKIVWWTLTVLCAAAVLNFSLQPVSSSMAMSGQMTDFVLQGDTEYKELPPTQKQTRNDIMHEFLRNFAHVIMFTALAFCATMLVRTYARKWWLPIATPLVMLYGVMDELIQQIRHNGRAFELLDVCRDWLGVAIGTALAAAVVGCLWLIRRRRV